MTHPPHPRDHLVSVGYATVAMAAGVAAFWQLTFGDFSLGMSMFLAACLAARCASALQTIAHQRLRLADPRRTDGEGQQ